VFGRSEYALVTGAHPSKRWGQIRKAALSMFYGRGYYVTRMQQIARLVDIRASSLYNHVRSKQELLVDIMGAPCATCRPCSPWRRPRVPARLRLRRAMGAHLCYYASHRREVRIGNREIPIWNRPRSRLFSNFGTRTCRAGGALSKRIA
jgi:hypothetical protein